MKVRPRAQIILLHQIIAYAILGTLQFLRVQCLVGLDLGLRKQVTIGIGGAVLQCNRAGARPRAGDYLHRNVYLAVCRIRVQNRAGLSLIKPVERQCFFQAL